MKLTEIYNRTSWLADELSLRDFINLFPVEYKKGQPMRPEKPVGLDLDRETYLAVLVAFKQSFS